MQRIQFLQDLVLFFCKPADEGHRVITLMKHPQPDAALTQTRTRIRIQTHADRRRQTQADADAGPAFVPVYEGT